ncbi:MAG: site-specific integrase [Ruminococcus sp.]|nr:site-specific integrase [Ruminococcus sp.]
MSRKGENIRKRRDGRYEARYKSGFNKNGMPIYKSIYGRTYSEARNNRLSFLSDNRKLKDKGNITIRDVSVQWLENKKLEVKKSTYSKYYDTVYNHIIQGLGGIKICNMNQALINQFVGEKSRKGNSVNQNPLKSKTIKSIINVLKQILKFTEKQYKCQRLNFEYIIPKEESTEIQTLSRDEQTRLINYLIKNPDRKNLALLICLNTGLRIGEICALRYGNVNQYRSCVCVRKTMQRIKNTAGDLDGKTIINIDEPKSKTSMRDIPVKKFLIDEINLFKGNENDFLLTGDQFKYVEPRSLENHFKRVLKENRIKKLNFHALRHTFATNMIEAGCDPKTLSELLGHADVQLTLKTYVHSSYELKQKSIEKLPEYCA